LNVLVLIVIIVAAVAAAVALMYAVRRLVRDDILLTDTERGSAIFGMVATAFAVLLAFVVFVAFESYNQAKRGAESEAVAIVELFRTAEFFPSVKRAELQGELGCYARAVVNHEWPVMRDGESSPIVDRWVKELKLTTKGFSLNTPRHRAAFAELLSQESDRVGWRRERISEGTPVVTLPVW